MSPPGVRHIATSSPSDSSSIPSDTSPAALSDDHIVFSPLFVIWLWHMSNSVLWGLFVYEQWEVSTRRVEVQALGTEVSKCQVGTEWPDFSCLLQWPKGVDYVHENFPPGKCVLSLVLRLESGDEPKFVPWETPGKKQLLKSRTIDQRVWPSSQPEGTHLPSPQQYTQMLIPQPGEFGVLQNTEPPLSRSRRRHLMPPYCLLAKTWFWLEMMLGQAYTLLTVNPQTSTRYMTLLWSEFLI